MAAFASRSFFSDSNPQDALDDSEEAFFHEADPHSGSVDSTPLKKTKCYNQPMAGPQPFRCLFVSQGATERSVIQVRRKESSNESVPRAFASCLPEAVALRLGRVLAVSGLEVTGLDHRCIALLGVLSEHLQHQVMDILEGANLVSYRNRSSFIFGVIQGVRLDHLAG